MLNRFAVIGNPVAHSLSPFIHQSFADQFAENLSYEKILTEKAQFKMVVEQFFDGGGRGLNITTPFKSLAAECVKHCSNMAKASDSVNTIFLDGSGSLCGESTDGMGWLVDIQRLNIALKNKKILVVGAGGAARILINTLLSESPQSLHIANRTEQRAQKLVTDDILSASDLENIPSLEWDLVINTLSVGWQGSYPDLSIELPNNSFAYDLNYGQGALPFKQWFISSGGSTDHFHDGWGMLVEQAAKSFQIWWNLKPVTEHLILKGKPT